ncbi:small-conductance mechanosensitive channel [Primorskyibacter sedentarius]|uniref:Small-conductance mechanosensitive channel n=1 Tax=Primorskyibacter sedentarius TaxID=745311 RepID=A0A4R3IW67_9RHOB|nr:mechanosensitive ion channel family protein [Primorskyibacter sedentarius]TCS54485.1 small-conductance mechanosensitive channel [Primorskyibacter sedentarius]
MANIETFLKSSYAWINTNSFVGAFVLLIGFFLFGLLLSAVLRRSMRMLIARDTDKRIDRLGAGYLARFSQVFLWVFVAMLYAHTVPALDKLATALLASVSIASVVIGLAAQSTLANLVAGLSLVLYKPFQLGDRLEINVPGGVETGTVESVSLGYTVLQTFDNRRLVLSNSTVANAVMINHTKENPRILAVVPFSIGYGADIENARSIVTELAKQHPDVQEVTGCPVVALNTSSVDLWLMGWCRDAATSVGVKYDLFEIIKKRFDEEGVEIPFAYQNIVLHQPSQHTSDQMDEAKV